MIVNSWGVSRIALHWLVAVLVFGLYLVGDYMVDLDYYDAWYQLVPTWHKSFGVLVLCLMLARVVLRIKQTPPQPLTSNAFEARMSAIVHLFLYVLVFIVCVSGYLISTADGRGIKVFYVVDIPALPALVENQEDLAGVWHYWASTVLVSLALLHALAAFKHHFIDKDDTLRRMLRIK